MLRSLCLILFVVPFFASIAAAQVPVEPQPDWVLPVVTDRNAPIPLEQIKSGTHYRLIDRQVYAGAGRTTQYFHHYSETIVNQSGLQNSAQINLDYSPQYEDIVLHRIEVLRDNKVIDKLADATISLLSREDRMRNLIYGGTKTVHIILSDIRIGDTLAVSYSRRGYNPVYQGIFGFNHALNWSVPVDKLHIRVVWDHQNPLHVTVINDTETPIGKKTRTGYEYVIEKEGVEAKLVEDQIPNWYSPYGRVYFSSVNSWREVAAWGSSLFEKAVEIDRSVQSVANDLKLQAPTKEAYVTAALQYVQQQIRYLSLSIGENSHRPAIPGETLQRRYGDCKDKSVLLVALLRAAQLDAYTALVNTDLRDGISERPAQPHIFDHAIVYLRLEEKDYWLDPTRNYQQAPLHNLSQSDYGSALVLRDGETKLTKMIVSNDHLTTSFHDHFDLSEGVEQAGLLTVTARYIGANAEYQRRRLEESARQDIAREYLEFYKKLYPATEIHSPIHIEDHSDTGILELREVYRINDPWTLDEDGDYEFIFHPYEITPYLREVGNRSRNDPLAISYPINIRQSITAKLHQAEWGFENRNFNEDNPYFFFSQNVEFDHNENILKLTYTYRSKTDHVPAKLVEDYAQTLENLSNRNKYYIYQYHNDPSTAPAHNNAALAIAIFYGLLIVLTITAWAWNHYKEEKFSGEMTHYPVGLKKIFTMWVFTLGLYSIYWFYKNWKYIKQRDESKIMPLARGLFCGFWYYPLYRDLADKNLEREEPIYLPGKFLALFLAAAFFLLLFLSNAAETATLPMLLSALLIFPLAIHILAANRGNKEAIQHNSKWSTKHSLLALTTAPVLIYMFASEIGLAAGNKIVEGKKLFAHQVSYIQNNGVIEPDEAIEMFYSAAAWDIRNDGNGFTSQKVFSYWREGDKFYFEAAHYSDIAEIDVKAGSWLEDTHVTITRGDGSFFVMYLSTTGRKDRKFIERVNKNWTKAKTKG